MSYTPNFINPFKTEIGGAILIDLSEAFYDVHTSIAGTMTDVRIISSIFIIAILCSYIIKVEVLPLLLALFRAILLMSIIPFLTFASLEIGCAIGDSLISDKNFLLKELESSKSLIGKGAKTNYGEVSLKKTNERGWIKAIERHIAEKAVNALNSVKDFAVEVDRFRKDSSKLSLRLFLKGIFIFISVSFSVYYFLFCALGYVQVLLSILPMYQGIYSGIFKTYGFGLTFPPVVVIMTNFLSMIAGKEIVDELSMIGVILAIVFMFMIFSSFKISKSLIDGMGAGDTAGVLGVSVAKTAATAVSLKALGFAAPLASAAGFAHGSLMNAASNLTDNKPPTGLSPFSGNLSKSEKALMAYRSITSPLNTIKEMSRRGDALSNFKSEFGAVPQDGIPLTSMNIDRLSNKTSTQLFDSISSKGRLPQKGVDYYHHDSATWASLDNDSKRRMGSKFNFDPETPQNNRVYYADRHVPSLPYDKHVNTTKAVSSHFEKLSAPTRQDHNFKNIHAKNYMKGKSNQFQGGKDV